jgi:acetamidase/formamidase
MSAHSIHQLRHDAHNAVWDNSIEPALEVDSGDVIELHAREASDEQLGESSSADDVPQIDFSRVNPVSGPVFVKGAGDTAGGRTARVPACAVGLDGDNPRPGAARRRVPRAVVSNLTRRSGARRGALRRPRHPTRSCRRRAGAAISMSSTSAPGTTLYLPVGVEGALFSLGDTHAAQGDGEVCGTAIETSMDVAVRLSVRRDISVQAPQFELPVAVPAEPSGYHVCTGVGPDLLEAARDAVRATITRLVERHGLDRQEAYALASVAVDLRIHEVVDAPNWVVGAFLPSAIFIDA